MSGTALNCPGRMRSSRAATARDSDVQRHAIRRSVKLSAVIWSSGEYLVLAASRPIACHSPSGTPWAAPPSGGSERNRQGERAPACVQKDAWASEVPAPRDGAQVIVSSGNSLPAARSVPRPRRPPS